MVHTKSNHAAPALGHLSLRLESEYLPAEFTFMKGADDEYHPVAVERTLESIGLALENMQPVRVGIASGVENRVTFNRRFVMRDGSGQMGLWGRPPADVAWHTWSNRIRAMYGDDCVPLVICVFRRQH